MNCTRSIVQEQYEKVSLPVVAFISLLSLLFNICNMVIFSKKEMTSPTNSILLGIAVSDFCKVFMFLLTTAARLPAATSYSGQIVYLCCNVCMFLMHAFALWCGVLLALFRFFYLRYYMSPRTKVWFGLGRARLAICAAFLANLLAMLPYISILQLKQAWVPAGNNSSTMVYYAGMQGTGEFQIRMFNSIAQKIVPCLIMTVLCVFIIHSLYKTERRRQSLANLNKGSSSRAAEAKPLSGKKEKRSRDHRRTTSFLLIIMLLYILYEIPMSLLIMLSDPAFNLAAVYCFLDAFSSIFNTLGLINNTVNFILYCFMSKQFRDVFKEAFGLNRLAEKIIRGGTPAEPPGNEIGLAPAVRDCAASASDQHSNSCLEY